MDKFTASNGVEIVRQPYAFVIRVPERPDFTVPLGGEEALREFFLAERDAELGRWRWPENPEYTVQRFSEAEVLVLFEPSGRSWVHDRLSAARTDFGVMTGVEAARAYFAAHPVRKPWEDAQPGEVWVLTGAGGVEQPWRRDNGFWLSCTTGERKYYDTERTTAGRRIWPEVS